MANETKTTRQVILYLLVGGGTALFELGAFEILYAFAGLDVSLSNVIAVFLATALNFALNGTVTFRSSSNLARSVVLYVVLFAFNTTFSTLAITQLTILGFPAVLAKLGTMGCIVGVRTLSSHGILSSIKKWFSPNTAQSEASLASSLSSAPFERIR